MTLERYSDLFSSMWDSHGNLSNLEQVDRLLFIKPLIFVVGTLNGSMLLMAKLLIVGLLVLAGVSFYVLADKLVGSCAPSLPRWGRSVICACAATLYELGPPVMYLASAYFYLLAYALTPLLIVLLFKAASHTRWWPAYAFLGGLLLTVASASPQHTLFLMVGLTVLSIVAIRRYGWHRSGWPIALFFCAFVATSLYWIVTTVPLAFSGALTPGYLLDWADTVVFSRNATLPNVVTGYAEWLVWWTPAGFWPPALLKLLEGARFIVPLAAAIVVWRFWNQWIVRWAAVIGAVAVVAAMGASSGLAPLYRFAMFRIPLFSTVGWFVRAPEKFEGYVWLVLLVLCVVGASLLVSRIGLRWGIGTIIVLGGIAFASTLPKNLAGFDGKYLPVRVPDSYYEVMSLLKQRTGATLWLAPYFDARSGEAGNLTYTWAPDHMAPVFVPDSMPGDVFGNYHYTNPFAQEYAYLYSHGDSLDRKLAALGIKTVVLADDLVGGHDGFVRLKRELDGSTSFLLLQQSGDLYVYAQGSQDPGLPAQFIAVQGGRASQEDVYASSGLNAGGATHLVYAEQQSDPGWMTGSKVGGGLYWLLDDRSELDVAMNRFVATYGISFTQLADNSALYGGWGRTLTSLATASYWPWHAYIQGFLGVEDPWDFDYGRGVIWTASNGVTVSRNSSIPPGAYELLIRGLTSVHSSSVTVRVGGLERAVALFSPYLSGVRWIDAGLLILPNGGSSVSLTNGQGHGVVNMVALVPHDRFLEAESQTRSLLARNGFSIVTHEATNRPANLFLPADTYKVWGTEAALTFIDLKHPSLVKPTNHTLTITSDGSFAAVASDVSKLVLAFDASNWAQAPGFTVRLQQSGQGIWKEEPVPTGSFAYLWSKRVKLPSGCNNLILVGSVDISGVHDFSANVRFYDSHLRSIGAFHTLAAVSGSAIDFNIGGVGAVPSGSDQVSVDLADRGGPGATIGRPIAKAVCGTWNSSATSRVGLSGQGGVFPAATGAGYGVLDAAYDPYWNLVNRNGNSVEQGVPVDGAITLFRNAARGDHVVYGPDGLLAFGWVLTIVSTVLVLLGSLVVAFLPEARRWVLWRSGFG